MYSQRQQRLFPWGIAAAASIAVLQPLAAQATTPPTAPCRFYSADLSSVNTTISGGQAFPGQEAVRSADDDLQIAASLETSANTYIGQDFGVKRELRRLRLFGTVSFGFHARLQFSDDARVWDDTSTIVNTGPRTRSWVEYDVAAYGKHRFWRLLDQGGYAYLQISEIEWQGCGTCADAPAQFTPDLTSPAAASSGGMVQPGYPASNAFDDNTNTVASIISSPGTSIGQDFGHDDCRSIRRLRVFRGSIGDYTFHARLQFSDDGMSWSDTSVLVGPLLTRDTEWHVYDVPEYGAHRFWRLLDQGGSLYSQVQEIEMLAQLACPELPSLSVNDAAVVEGDYGKTEARFEVRLSQRSDETVTVDFKTEDFSSERVIDYDVTQGTLTFPPGVTAMPVGVPVNGDRRGEANETFFLVLSRPVHAVLGRAAGRGTIFNDDWQCAVFVHPSSFSYGAEGGEGRAIVRAGLDCGWNAASTETWVTVSREHAFGDADLAFTVAPNPTSVARHATLWIQGEAIDISQAAGTALEAAP